MSAPRPDPDQLLRQAQAEEEYARRGHLKVFLGYSGGVGKSFRMLDEGRRRRERGQDVVVGALQPRNPPEVVALLPRLEVIPMLVLGGMAAMDVVAILHRRPEVCLVDGLAHANPSGATSSQRWQDVEVLLEAGISVITTVNLQFIAERAVAVERITDRRVAETVPESLLRSADEIEIVDAPADLLMSGPETVASPPTAGDAQRRRQQLSELRELALLLAADVVDEQLEAYLRRHGLEPSWGTQERILICLSAGAAGDEMIASGRRNAERFHGELLVAYPIPPIAAAAPDPELRQNLELARAAGAAVFPIDARDFVPAVLDLAHRRGVTQIFLGHAARPPWWRRWRATPLDRLIARAEGIDIRVFPSRPSHAHG